MRIEGSAIGPAFEEHQSQSVVRVDRDAVLEAAGLGAGAGDVLETRRAQSVEAVGASGDGAGDDEHGDGLVRAVAGHRSRPARDDTIARPLPAPSRRMFRPPLLALVIGFGFLGTAHGDESTLAIPAAHARLGFERIRFTGDRERVGLVGASYLVDIGGLPGVSLGPAVYGAVTGDRGGLFTIGGEAAWRQRVFGPVGVELGVYVGGGGGGGVPQGSGLMLRPHADLVWDLGAVALGLSVSRVRFSSGLVDSTQIGLVLNASNDFRFVPAERLGDPLFSGGRAGLGFDRVQFVGGVYRTPAGRLLRDGDPLPRTISLLGIRAEQSWGRNAFWGVEANRAARGGVGGYAEILGTVGFETEIVRDSVTLGGRIALGAGGGGSVSTGGGLLAKAGVYSVVRVSGDLGIALEAGVARAPNGNFRAVQGSAALVWALDSPDGGGAAARPSRTDFSAGAIAHDAPRADGSTRSLRAITLKIDRFLTPGFYVSGEALGAAGGNASGYSGALVGAGWNQRFGPRLHAGAELLAGASGGGGVASGGVLLQPRVYAGVQVTPALALRVGAGRLKATSGPLASTFVDASLVFTYGVSAGN